MEKPGLNAAKDYKDYQEEFLKRKKLNTFKERRKEGRTMHTRLSVALIIAGILGLVLQGMSLAVPSWRSSYMGLIGYATRRHWGLFTVWGSRSQMHHTVSSDTCAWSSQLIVLNSCLSPICKWYLLKCQRYFDLMLFSYGTGVVIVLCWIIQVLCVVWSFIFSTRTIRFAATWYPVIALFSLAGTIFWVVMTEVMFQELDEKSFYPVPPIGASFIASVGAIVCQIANSIMARQLKYMWPEIDPDDPHQFSSSEDDEDDSDEDSDEETKPKKAKAKGAAHPPQVQQVQQVGFAPQQEGGPQERQWFYQDQMGNVQGPFPTSQMQQWYASGTFPADMPLRAETEATFTPLGDGSRFAQAAGPAPAGLTVPGGGSRSSTISTVSKAQMPGLSTGGDDTGSAS
eukprot:TRINITY_DN90556_c0_g1_i1.p1 TRINITY_DN90556_c0_g1~~TRINITY_DN90556_c0_g1_i1.p1  ORF type:complete len:399 (+),score=74.64 TRINITY_DN90556_c0_g1_i1:159-1355(+)